MNFNHGSLKYDLRESLNSHDTNLLILGEADLQGRYDVVRVELQPSEQYKSVCSYKNCRPTQVMLYYLTI